LRPRLAAGLPLSAWQAALATRTMWRGIVWFCHVMGLSFSRVGLGMEDREALHATVPRRRDAPPESLAGIAGRVGP